MDISVYEKIIQFLHVLKYMGNAHLHIFIICLDLIYSLFK